MDLRTVVGLNVQRIRRGQGLSQEELSFRSGFTRAYLSGLEAGRRNPTLLSLAKIAEALSITIEELLRAPQSTPAAGSKRRRGSG
ncbi:helix-turn-helix domain-containing protein [Mesorhizobium sp. B292B1B]|uniref:helix-turn-helix domain-containing protein n=1 Tax=unclassified Mesorhizobium TaxID=325217 RepID=UPI00112DE8B2|nr:MULTISPECIES: helix-turn-helix transcriptional regulator [unclassified Mesorhizobium]MBZ9921927.1 helix-turn-helix domain-containing protein [Mesorhizobium sp. BR1-1-7]MBZ9965898.1 helix-turn-helix domain-containing protein [Mesorhizobium sp. BR1-1-2]MCA0012031.1 helix-turn-helix domain-containing protein [Mesorhizobium sp. B294B1A1]MCA0038285.1 helix-turn-helix domain-containing protein [Mesorhizobium sp. B292B1B]TPM43993.1 helix-turn-helix transcriptional regulator [Mesorhizobium sp. B2-3